MIAINSSKKAENDLVSAVDVIRKRFALLKEEVSQSSNDELKDEITKSKNKPQNLHLRIRPNMIIMQVIFWL